MTATPKVVYLTPLYLYVGDVQGSKFSTGRPTRLSLDFLSHSPVPSTPFDWASDVVTTSESRCTVDRHETRGRSFSRLEVRPSGGSYPIYPELR